MVARTTGYSIDWIRHFAKRYREGGPEALDDWRHGNPGGGWALLNPALRADLRMALEGSAPDGGLWTGPKVAQWLSERLGHPVQPQRGWEALRSLSFTAQWPRPRAVRADHEGQVTLSKGASRPWSTL